MIANDNLLPASITNLLKPERSLSCAETAKLVRKALKEAFPEIKFSVRSSVYSGGASIDISWQDGPLTAQVEAIAKRFAGASFDGMTDSKSYHRHALDGEPVSFGANYVFCTRHLDDAKVAALAGIIGKADRADWLTLAGKYGLAQAMLQILQYHPDAREFAQGMLRNLPAPEFSGRRSATAESVTLLS